MYMHLKILQYIAQLRAAWLETFDRHAEALATLRTPWAYVVMPSLVGHQCMSVGTMQYNDCAGS